MKIKTTISYCCKAILCIALINSLGSEVKAQSTVTVSRPTNTMYYEHDRTNWVHVHNTVSTYNSNGWLLSAINTDPVTNQNLDKTEYTLNAFDKVNTITGSMWQNNAWVINSGSNYIRTYNANNKLTELTWELWKAGALVNERKDSYVYDASGNLIEATVSFYRNNAWQLNDKSIYTYVNNIQTERLINIFNKTTATWMPVRKIIYAGWHVPNVQATITTDQGLDANGNWVNLTRTTITPGLNGSFGELRENYQNGIWIYSTRSTRTNDANGNVTDFLFEEYVNSTWRMVWIDKLFYTYSAQNDLLEEIYQGQDSTYGPLRNMYKEVYSNFQYFTRALGTSENQKTELALSVYPNPATDKIQIQLAESKPQVLTATLKDITGKNFLSKTFKSGEAKQLNIEALPKGIYLLQLQTEAGSTVKRIVKQ